MNQALVRPWWVAALRGVIAILFGIAAVTLPNITLLSLVILFSFYALSAGAVSIYGAIKNRRQDDHWWLPLMWGLLSVGVGIAALFNTGITVLVLVFLMGAYALMTGALDIVMAIRLRKTIQGEWLLALSGVVSIIFGLLIFMFPGAGILTLVWMVGFYVTFTGVLLISLAFRLKAQNQTGGQFTERRVIPDRRQSQAYTG